jgi:hypothetical protein
VIEVTKSRLSIQEQAMPYVSDISRSTPSAFVILLDQSSSMADPFAGGGDSKSVEAARVVNKFLAELTIKCAKAEGIRDYYDVAVLGYGRGVSNAFGGGLASGDLQPISSIGDNPARLDTVNKKVPDGAGGLVEESSDVPVWIEAKADGMTPMCQALSTTRDILQRWVVDRPNSFPPTVLNITDGEANDGDPIPLARALRGVATNDGEVLLFNCHLSSKRGPQVQFPESSAGLVDSFASMLFEMSSELPPAQLEAARAEGFAVTTGSRGFVFNASLEDLIRFVDIGTRATLR